MIYLDSADRTLLAPLLATGLFAGVTTNPTILDRAGLSVRDLPDLAAWLRDHGVDRFYAQACGETVDDLRRSADEIATLGDTTVIKLVAHTTGLTVARELVQNGREVLITAAYHPTQSALAAAAGAQEIAPYVGRASEQGRDGIALVREMAQIAGGPRILAASLRTPDQLAATFAAGAQDATVSPALAAALLNDELTLRAHAEFESISRQTQHIAS